MAGLDKYRRGAGRLFWKGRETTFPTHRQVVDLGMALVPEPGKEQGPLLGTGGREHVTLPHLAMFSGA